MRPIIAAALIAILLGPAFDAHAQTTEVTGVVRDQTGAVLPGVIIDLVSGKRELTSVTDREGAFRFDGVPAGPAELTFRLLNFSVLRRTVDVATGQRHTADVVMMLALSADVVVTGSATFRNIADVENPSESLVGIASAASQGAVTARDLDTRPVMRAGEVLETVPGMIVSQHSGEGKANQYYLRGFNLDHGTDFSTTVAGVPVNTPTGAHAHGYADASFLIPELVSGVQYKGEIGYFYNLAEYLHPEQPVYGLQAPVEPFDDLEAMAAHYVAEVREHQPHGPYLLGGYCIGGCVAFEMARTLAEAGESVRLVAMIDAVMPARQSFARRLKRFARKPWREQLEGLKRRANMVTDRLRGVGSIADELPSFYGVPSAFHAIALRHYRAQLHYVPRPYAGDVWLFRSRHQADPDLGWRPLVRGTLQIQEVPGKHADVLKEPHLRETARQLSMVVDTAAARDS